MNHKNVDFGRPNTRKTTEDLFQQMPPSLPSESCSPDLRIDEDAVSLQSSESTEISLNKKEVLNRYFFFLLNECLQQFVIVLNKY